MPTRQPSVMPHAWTPHNPFTPQPTPTRTTTATGSGQTAAHHSWTATIPPCGTATPWPTHSHACLRRTTAPILTTTWATWKSITKSMDSKTCACMPTPAAIGQTDSRTPTMPTGDPPISTMETAVSPMSRNTTSPSPPTPNTTRTSLRHSISTSWAATNGATASIQVIPTMQDFTQRPPVKSSPTMTAPRQRLQASLTKHPQASGGQRTISSPSSDVPTTSLGTNSC